MSAASASENAYHELPSRLGPVWRDANVRTGPSLDSPVVQLLLPDAAVDHRAEGWQLGDEVVEGEHRDGVIVSSVWFKLDGGWSSAVNFEPETVSKVLEDAVRIEGVPTGSALSRGLHARIVAETGAAAPSTDDAVEFEEWLEAVKVSHEELYAGVAAEIESHIMTKGF
ncbi:hypothetical protein ACFCZ1_36945 [Streptomyces sp. NPDC056224]|uniref:hypothetical protein n=1 Tax=Streptomyces sp. NPDC056224 TaxID=3345750 RepID=UPI0035DF9A7E